MGDIAIYGAGGLGREIACLIRRINETCPAWDLVGFFDDDASLKGRALPYGPVLGGLPELNAWEKPLSLVMAIGAPDCVRGIVSQIRNPRIAFPNLVSPNADFADLESVVMGKGNVIQRLCMVSCGVTVGDFNVLNSGAGLGHDVRMGSFNSLMPAARVSGGVRIGDGNYLGAGSIVLQQIRIGDGVKLGAGAVLMTRPKDRSVYVGNPARIFKY